MTERYEYKDIISFSGNSTINVELGREAITATLVNEWKLSEEVAKRHANHEVTHKVVDTGGGRIGVCIRYTDETDQKGKVIDTYYISEGIRTNREIILIAEAPGSDMSEADRLVVHEAKKRIALYGEE